MLNYAHDVLKRLQTLLVISPVSINNNNNALLALTTKRHIYMASDKLQ